MDNSTSGNDDLDFNIFKKVLDDFLCKYSSRFVKSNIPQTGFKLQIAGGGEPTYNFDLLHKIVDYSRNVTESAGIKLDISITSNGIWDDSVFKFITENVSSILISYDGTSSIQNKNRPLFKYGDSSERVENTLYKLSKKVESYSVRTVIIEDDYIFLKDMLDHLFDITGLKGLTWSINPVSPRGRAKSIINVQDRSFFDYYKELLDYAKSKYNFESISSPIFKDTFVDCYCGAFSGTTSYWLKPDHMLYTCTDCKLDPIATVIEGRVAFENDYHDILKESYSKMWESQKCKDCIAYMVCRGGCPARYVNFGPDSDAFKKECNNLKMYWRSVIEEDLIHADIHAISDDYIIKAHTPSNNGGIGHGIIKLQDCDEMIPGSSIHVVKKKIIGSNCIGITDDGLIKQWVL